MDSSFVSDDGSFLQPTTTSTPRKKCMLCPHCGKKYMLKHYLNKHVLEKHSDEVNNNDTQNVTQLHLDASDLSFNIQTISDTSNPFKKPAPPVKKTQSSKVQKKKKFVCTYCLRAYVSETTMKTHMRIHTVQVAAARFPDSQEILAHAEDIGQKALIKVANSPSYGCAGQLFKELVGHVVASSNFNDFSVTLLKEMVTVIETKKCMMPSALLKALSDEMENILCNEELYNYCLDLLEVSAFDNDAQSQFMVEFMLNFLTEVFTFISASFRKHYERPLKPMPDLDVEDRQVIYYIAGSIMRGYLRIAYRHKNNSKWQSVCSVLQSHVLSAEPLGDIDAAWTRDVDRGSLLYINMACQKFFLSLTKVVYENEKSDGSIDFNQIIGIVSKTDISVQWDNVIKDALSQELSVGLMTDVVQCFCKACGRGIARRRLNAIREKPVISMPTRHTVASRKR
ncbi:Escargot/snail protein-like protein [Frankliniella fusca]|uniref:Escargot/snail protein-like protein n=1 Tax=Frankliniella fusca TaxID=407009 RepID=A0AAE1GST8_9NEOP|nr:Escargot/snail protein-like protein [Frankliniella fusca]